MTNGEFEKQLCPPNIAFSPAFFQSRFDQMKRKYGSEKVKINPLFKKAREMWITSTSLLALTEIEKLEFWLYPEHTENTPDTYGFFINKHSSIKDGFVKNLLSFEIKFWDAHSESDLVQFIERVLRVKCYPDYFYLLVYAHWPKKNIDLKEINQRLIGLRLNVSNVFFLVGIESENDIDHSFSNIYPGKSQFNFSLQKLLEKYKYQTDMIKIDLPRGKGAPCRLDDAYHLPLPDLPI
jgi:hypothetical protein